MLKILPIRIWQSCYILGCDKILKKKNYLHSFFESLLFYIFGKMALAWCQKKSDCLAPWLQTSHICLLPAAIKKVKWRGRRRSAVRTCIIFLPFARPTQFLQGPANFLDGFFLLILAKSVFFLLTQTYSLAMLSQICNKQLYKKIFRCISATASTC